MSSSKQEPDPDSWVVARPEPLLDTARVPRVRRSHLLSPAPRKEPRGSREPGDPHAGHAAIYAVVRAIPRGKIATYGQIAALAGIPNGHRVAAAAMRACPAGLPWQRVLGKKDARRAQVNIADGEHALLQRRLLEREGVEFDEDGLTQLGLFGWLPSDMDREQPRKRRSLKR